MDSLSVAVNGLALRGIGHIDEPGMLQVILSTLQVVEVYVFAEPSLNLER